VGIEPTQPLLAASGRLATACITNLPVFQVCNYMAVCTEALALAYLCQYFFFSESISYHLGDVVLLL
jgi:hypothetical protein